MRFKDVPKGGQRACYVLKLNSSLYGLKKASANWYEMLSAGLESRGFLPSKVDPCVFIGKDAIIITYVDDHHETLLRH